MINKESKAADALRRRVEALLNKSPESLQPADLQRISTLAHELAIYQAELELQNEELRNTQLALKQTIARFSGDISDLREAQFGVSTSFGHPFVETPKLGVSTSSNSYPIAPSSNSYPIAPTTRPNWASLHHSDIPL
jgi:hypothetical protein